jgi:hypothetical protein
MAKNLEKKIYCKAFIEIPVIVTGEVTSDEMEQLLETSAKEIGEGAMKWLESQSGHAFNGVANFASEKGNLYFE